MTKTTTTSQAITRKRRVRTRSLSPPEGIAASPDGVDQRLLRAALELGAEAVDVDLDDVRGPLPVGLPQLLTEHLARHHLPRVAHQHLQDAEFRRRQVDLHVAAGDPARRQVEDEVADR